MSSNSSANNKNPSISSQNISPSRPALVQFTTSPCQLVCRHCNFSTDFHMVFTRHMVCHFADKGYECALCIRTFYSENDLRLHISVDHLGHTSTPVHALSHNIHSEAVKPTSVNLGTHRDSSVFSSEFSQHFMAQSTHNFIENIDNKNKSSQLHKTNGKNSKKIKLDTLPCNSTISTSSKVSTKNKKTSKKNSIAKLNKRRTSNSPKKKTPNSKTPRNKITKEIADTKYNIPIEETRHCRNYGTTVVYDNYESTSGYRVPYNNQYLTSMDKIDAIAHPTTSTSNSIQQHENFDIYNPIDPISTTNKSLSYTDFYKKQPCFHIKGNTTELLTNTIAGNNVYPTNNMNNSLISNHTNINNGNAVHNSSIMNNSNGIYNNNTVNMNINNTNYYQSNNTTHGNNMYINNSYMFSSNTSSNYQSEPLSLTVNNNNTSSVEPTLPPQQNNMPGINNDMCIGIGDSAIIPNNNLHHNSINNIATNNGNINYPMNATKLFTADGISSGYQFGNSSSINSGRNNASEHITVKIDPYDVAPNVQQQQQQMLAPATTNLFQQQQHQQHFQSQVSISF